jgi:hypothetical protein
VVARPLNQLPPWVIGNQEKKKREHMFKKDTRRGLALGAAFSLLATLFVAAPAAQADEAGVVVTPFVGTSDTMLITEEFVLKTRLGLTVDASKISNLKYFIEKPAGYSVSLSNTVSASIGASAFAGENGGATNSNIIGTATSSVIIPTSPSTTALNQLRLQIFSTSSTIDSMSAAVTIKVTAFLDIDPDSKFASTEPHQTFEVKFVPWSAMAASVTVAAQTAGSITASATAAISGVNVEQLNGDLRINLKTTYGTGSSVSDDLKGFAVAGAMSYSQPVSASAPVDSSVSAILHYDTNNDSTLVAGEVLATSMVGVAIATIAGVTASPVTGANLLKTGAGSADARLSSTFALKAWAFTGSTVVAAKIPTFTVTTSTVVLSTTKYLVVNGVTYTQSSVLNGKSLALTAGTDGKGDISITTVGFATGEVITVGLQSENRVGNYAVTPMTTTYSVSRTAGAFIAALAGESVTAVFDVADQFGVATPLADQTVVFSIAGNAVTTSTQSIAVVGGKASVTVTPKSATVTGSYTITPDLFYSNRAGVLTADTDAPTAVTVNLLTNLNNSISTKPVASVSASISYGAAMSWSAAVSANVGVTGSQVVVSAPGVMFLYDSKSYSDTVTMTAGSAGAVSFQATSRLAGSYTMSFVAGTATASTTLVVAPALFSAGASLTFDKSSIDAGATSTIVGTLVDANGNPVATETTGSLVVKWTGKGLPFNLPGSVDTDADGKFEFQVLVLGTEVGQAAISATYQPNGLAVDTKNLTFVQAVNVVVAGAAPVVETQKVNVGSFKGFVALYAKGYEGQRMSAIVAGKWIQVASLKSGFERVVRFTGAGYDITVKIYIDGKQVGSDFMVLTK